MLVFAVRNLLPGKAFPRIHPYRGARDLGDTHARDGGGYDMDLGTIDSYVQYNYSHDNYGEGMLTLTWPVGFG